MKTQWVVTITFQDQTTKRTVFGTKREAVAAEKRALSSRIVMYASVKEESA